MLSEGPGHDSFDYKILRTVESLEVVRNDFRKEIKIEAQVAAKLFVSSDLDPFLPGTSISSFSAVLSGI
jgi:hypothetical protein